MFGAGGDDGGIDHPDDGDDAVIVRMMNDE